MKKCSQDQLILSKALIDRDVKTFSEKYKAMIEEKIKEKTHNIFKKSISDFGIPCKR